MIKCPSCGNENFDGSQFCDECGQHLGSFSLPPQNEYVAPPDYLPPSQPDFVGASVTSIGIPPIVEEQMSDFPKEFPPQAEVFQVPKEISHKAQEIPVLAEPSKSKSFHSTLIIERGSGVGAEFELSGDESFIGRWDADNGVFPDVDLDAHDPEAKVSRRHARIFREGGHFIIEDSGSTNGTFVNRGRRLIPGNRQPLEDGDEIIVGKTFLRFRIKN